MIRFRCMGTEVCLLSRGPRTPAATRSMAMARASLHAAEAELSRFREDSGLSRLNRAAGRGPCVVSPLLLDVLQAALAAARAGDGFFDPTVGAALCQCGYDRSLEQLAPPPADWWRVGPLDGIRPAGLAAPLDGIALDPAGATVSLPSGAAIDLGGFAKSWLADRICASIASPEALVDLGGDVAVRGAWSVGVFHDRPLGVFEVEDAAVATSSILRRAWRDGGGRVAHHVIDPRTRQPAESDLHSVTVVAPTCVEAELEARRALITGSRAAMERLAARGHRAVMSLRDGRVEWLPAPEVP